MKPLLVLILALAGAALGGPRTAASATPAGAATIHARVEIQPQAVTIGDRIAYVATFAAPVGVRVVPAYTATRFDDWEVLDARPLPAGPGEQKFALTVVVWSATLTAVPRIPFTISAPGLKPQMMLMQPVALTVTSVLGQAKDPGEMKPPKGMIDYRSWWPWILGALALAALAALVWWWRRRRAAALAGPAGPVVPPELTAREALARLLASAMLEEGRVKEFYSELSDIFRRYLEGRFGVPALDRTTAELLPSLRAHGEVARYGADLREFLEDADLVKFAKLIPDRAETDADVGRVRAFIEATAPQVNPAPAAAPVLTR